MDIGVGGESGSSVSSVGVVFVTDAMGLRDRTLLVGNVAHGNHRKYRRRRTWGREKEGNSYLFHPAFHSGFIPGYFHPQFNDEFIPHTA